MMRDLHRSAIALAIFGTFLLGIAIPAAAQGEGAERLKAHFELGFLGVMSHKIQFSNDGTYISYPEDGGQDNLFAFSRMSLDLRISERSKLIFLYQPLDLVTQNLLGRDIRVDGLTFPAGTPVRFTYKFPFYRVSYLYDLNADPDEEFAVGFSLQIRNATIEFESLDGTLFRSNHNIGPVPILKLRWTHWTNSGFFLGAEADGFYAPISYINGSDNEVVGAILDASVRAGLALTAESEAFLNVRYLGGGAVGTSEPDGPGDGYVKNWLHFLSVTVGISLKIF